MNKKVMMDLLDRGHDGNSILQILDALCDGMGDSAGGETPDDMTETVENTEELVEMEEKELVEA